MQGVSGFLHATGLASMGVLALLAARPALADVVQFSFSGECTQGCSGSATGLLSLSVTPGVTDLSALDATDFTDFTYTSSDLGTIDITSADVGAFRADFSDLSAVSLEIDPAQSKIKGSKSSALTFIVTPSSGPKESSPPTWALISGPVQKTHQGASGSGDAGGAYAWTEITAVPEPASWALMIAGFGLTGAQLRRRRGGFSFSRG